MVKAMSNEIFCNLDVLNIITICEKYHSQIFYKKSIKYEQTHPFLYTFYYNI
jgi:hypothetical protein